MLRVTTWQRKARLIIAIAAAAFAVALVLAFKKREPAAAPITTPTADPNAIVESAKGFTFRLNRSQEVVRIDYATASNYADGSAKVTGVTITTERAGGRRFIVTGKQGDIKNEQNYSLSGDVHLCALPAVDPKPAADASADHDFGCDTADALVVRTERAEYTDADGLVRAPAALEFVRGRMSGTGRGLVYSKNLDTLTILNEPVVHVGADANGAGAMDITSESAEFNRGQKIIRFTGMVKVTRGDGETIEADLATAHLSEDEQRLEAVDLEGHARSSATKAAAGSLRSMEGRAISLKYAADGQLLQRATITGDARVRVAADGAQTDREINAIALDVTMAPDGTTPTALAARDNVQVTMPGQNGSPVRTITAKSLDGEGEAGRGLSRARFTGGVVFRERGGDIDRTGRAETLDAAMTPGLGEIHEARFARGVRFEEKGLTAVAAAARYVLDKSALELSGADPANPTPHIVNERISVYATRIDVTFSGPLVHAVGSVKSELLPPRKEGAPSAAKSDARMPSMFKQDQVVTATSGELTYDGGASRATYSKAAQLWQSETSIKASSITVDEKTGNLAATGPVVTTTAFDQEQKDKTKARVRSTAASKEFAYDEAARRATYTGDAHVTGPQGDMTADKVELYLKPSGDELDRVEAYDHVTLRDQKRDTRGDRMTYFSDGERYVVTGAPVTLKDECGRESTGQRVTFDKNTDTVIVDGAERSRTQTKGSGSSCP